MSRGRGDAAVAYVRLAPIGLLLAVIGSCFDDTYQSFRPPPMCGVSVPLVEGWYHEDCGCLLGCGPDAAPYWSWSMDGAVCDEFTCTGTYHRFDLSASGYDAAGFVTIDVWLDPDEGTAEFAVERQCAGADCDVVGDALGEDPDCVEQLVVASNGDTSGWTPDTGAW